eukprot:c10677_g1_i1.p1 GENE.c10677_g1_i1~~c10677_g1_i1.p1  ORF type:complete len:599 (-),score=185.50 c10677_g1_i1:1016-2707(-)
MPLSPELCFSSVIFCLSLLTNTNYNSNNNISKENDVPTTFVLAQHQIQQQQLEHDDLTMFDKLQQQFEQNEPFAGGDLLKALEWVEQHAKIWILNVLNTIIVFGVAFVYLPQYLQIRRTKNAEGFSLYVPLILLASNILRIMYWFGKRFAIPLLGQAITTVIVQLLMLELCIRTHSRRERTQFRRLWDCVISDFWNWTDFTSYCIVVSVFTLISGVISIASMHNSEAISVLGFVALGVEAVLPLPQCYRNHVRRSTQGLNNVMVITWFLSDLLKTVYFLATAAPTPFMFCGIFQCFVDLIILIQIRIFGNKVSPSSSASKATHSSSATTTGKKPWRKFDLKNFKYKHQGNGGGRLHSISATTAESSSSAATNKSSLKIGSRVRQALPSLSARSTRRFYRSVISSGTPLHNQENIYDDEYDDIDSNNNDISSNIGGKQKSDDNSNLDLDVVLVADNDDDDDNVVVDLESGFDKQSDDAMITNDGSYYFDSSSENSNKWNNHNQQKRKNHQQDDIVVVGAGGGGGVESSKKRKEGSTKSNSSSENHDLDTNDGDGPMFEMTTLSK